MKEYIISLITAALLASLIGLLSPQGEGGGLSRHLRLLTSLFLLCVLLSPAIDFLLSLKDAALGDALFPEGDASQKEEYEQSLDEALSSATGTYLATLLTDALEAEFSIPEGEVRCSVTLSEDGSRPTRIRVILSGSAIWKDPEGIEAFVTERVGCECVTAIE